MIVSTRYHPLVFGIAAGVPCLAIYQDRYTATKLAGALAQAGLAGWRLPIEALLTDLPGDVFDEVWSRREELSEHLHSVTADWPSKQEAHWDEVWQAITVGPSNPGSHPRPISGGGDPVCGEVVPKLAGLASVNVIADEHLRATEALEFNWRAAFTEAERYALSLEGAFAAGTLAHRGAAEALAITARKVDDLEARLSDLDLRRATVAADNLHLVDEIRHAERSAQAARDLVGALRERLETAIEHGATVAGALVVAETRAADLAAYVGALHATKTLRWTRPLRSIYGRFLR